MDDWKTFSFPFGAFRPIFKGEELLVSGMVFGQKIFTTKSRSEGIFGVAGDKGCKKGQQIIPARDPKQCLKECSLKSLKFQIK